MRMRRKDMSYKAVVREEEKMPTFELKCNIQARQSDVKNFFASLDLDEIERKKQQMQHNCTRQAQMLFYGAYNWKSTEETLLDE